MFKIIGNKPYFTLNYLHKRDSVLIRRFKCNSCEINQDVANISPKKHSNLQIHFEKYKKMWTKLHMDSRICPLALNQFFIKTQIHPILKSSYRNVSTVCHNNNNSIARPLAQNLFQRRPVVQIIKHTKRQQHSSRKLSATTLSEKITTKNITPILDHVVASKGEKPHSKAQEPVCVTDQIITDETHLLHPKFAATPKNILHNVYHIVMQELKNNNYKVLPVYHTSKEKKAHASWTCTYHVRWPDVMKFVGTGKTKRECSHKAALACLVWLKKHDKIDKEGQPIIIDNNQQKELVKKTTPVLALDDASLGHIDNILALHEQEFMPKLVKNKENVLQSENDFDENCVNDLKRVNVGKGRQPMFLGVNEYFAKEKVVLPIAEYKEQFIEMLKSNSVVIIKGEPGCGKSTRIPQYVLESWIRDSGTEGGPCRIAVTQPRRIAAISLAERVSNERDENVGHIVGYQVRLRSNFNQSTGRILYCTTGILLRHLQSDPNLSNFTHIILDEAHERDVNTDLLMNILREILQTNSKLKLIVMSATIDTDMFKEYFSDAPLLHIPGFAYPVKPYYLEDTKRIDLSKTRAMCESESPTVVHEDVVKLINFIHVTKPGGAILCFLPGWEDISKIQKLIQSRASNDVSVLCLHSRLHDSDQRKIFSKPPPGVRKIILATNIAETSVTIDDVVYVVDTGIHKETRFDNDKGILCIDNHWVSKSSMIQRKGRAGRVQPGESFHLYTKSKSDAFSPFTIPEILRTSLTKIVLDSKVYSNNQDALEFMNQLLSPPEKIATRRAVRELKDLELLDENENLTPLGKTLAEFQLEPKLAKVLVNSVVYKCVTPIVDIITLFSADTEIFSSSLTDKEGIKNVKRHGCRDSDHLALMRLFEKWLELMDEQGEFAAERFCKDAGISHHKLRTMEKLRSIHYDYLRNGLRDSVPISDNNSDNDELVKAVLLSGVGTLLQHRNWDVVKGRYKVSNVFLTNYNNKATITSESVNFKKTSFPSNFLVYINEVRSNIRRTTLVRESSVISPLAVLLFSNKPLAFKETATQDYENVILYLADTKVEFLCKKQDAEHIIKCKETLNAAYRYFIFQMTAGGDFDLSINQVWDKILSHVDKILLNCSV